MRASNPQTRSSDRRGARYLLVGVFNTVWGFAVFAGLLALGDGLHYLLILVVAHVIAVLTAFWLHRTLVFRVEGRLLGDLWRFWSVYLAGLALNAILLPLLVETVELNTLVAQAMIVLALAVTSYIAHIKFTFVRPVRSSSTEQPIP